MLASVVFAIVASVILFATVISIGQMYSIKL
jgi:hypothetical protein